MSALPKNIQLIRGLLNMTQDEFGRLVIPGEQNSADDPKKIKKLRSKISSYEKDVAQPPFAVLANIAKAGGVTIDQLTSKELTLTDVNIKTSKSSKSNNTEAKELNLPEMIELIRKEMTLIKATLKVHSLKIINIEAKVMNSPFDEVFSDHEKKIAQEIMRLEEQLYMN